MSKQKKIIFVGTSDFGLPALRALDQSAKFSVIAVITQPDKKVGRNLQIQFSPIKKYALTNNIPIMQPEKIIFIEKQIHSLAPDFLVVAAYAQIIPEKILVIPSFGCINIHASLLPYCRGASCVQGPILDGKNKTGVTIILMDSGIDTGPILAQRSIAIQNDDTAGSLFRKLSDLGGRMIVPTLLKYFNQQITPRPQAKENITYSPILTKKDGHINFQKSAADIHRFIRAMTPWPSAYAFLKKNDKIIRIKILKARVALNLSLTDKYPIGTLFANDRKLYIVCGHNSFLMVLELQIEGKKPLLAVDFIHGYGDFLNKKLT